jgi:hypothetical protein
MNLYLLLRLDEFEKSYYKSKRNIVNVIYSMHLSKVLNNKIKNLYKLMLKIKEIFNITVF